jgi:hypothetical protein
LTILQGGTVKSRLRINSSIFAEKSTFLCKSDGVKAIENFFKDAAKNSDKDKMDAVLTYYDESNLAFQNKLMLIDAVLSQKQRISLINSIGNLYHIRMHFL